jgi:hypothetical protein
MFFDHIPPDEALADLRKKEREEWEALLFLEELGILVLSHPAAPSANEPAEKDDNETKLPKAA